MVSAIKDPVKVRAGTIGARTRWGDQPRIVRLDSLTSEQRRLVIALVEAAKSRPDKEAAPVSETSGTAREARRAADERPSAA